jgi:predicted anti-sigma-YlaC factor YlaD
MTQHRHGVQCRELVERVTDLLDGGLDEAERVRLEQHIVWCEMCADYVDQMRHATRLLAHLGASEDVLDHEDAAAIATDLLRRAAAQGGRS